MDICFLSHINIISFRVLRKRIFLCFFLLLLFVSLKAQQTLWLDSALQLVEKHYTLDFDQQKVPALLLNQIMEGLDPYSCFLTDSAHQSRIQELSGYCFGLDLEGISLLDTFLVVQSSVEELPQGSRIVSVNGNKPVSNAKARLYVGTKEDSLCIIALLPSKYSTEILRLKSEKMIVPTVFGPFFPNKETALLRIEVFGRKTANELHKKLLEIRKKKIKQIIIDLRGNKGGLIEVAASVCSEFIEKGRLLFYMEGKDEKRRDFISTGSGLFPKGRVLVLTDSLTSSSAEAMAAAFQEQKRALIAGQNTFGKGVVQYPFPLAGYGYLYLTVAFYYSPQGHCLQKSFSAPLSQFQSENNEGGIDVDFSFYDDNIFSINSLEADSVFYKTALSYFYLHPQIAFSDPQLYQRSFNVDDVLLGYLLDKVWKQQGHLHLNPVMELALKNKLKAQLALFYFGSDVAYKLNLLADPMLGPAVELISNEQEYTLRAVRY